MFSMTAFVAKAARVITTLLFTAVSALAGIGIVYTITAAVLVARFGRKAADAPVTAAPVTILKPLYGAEPRLADNLESFLAQRWAAPVQLLCGVASESDGARAAVEALKARHPEADIVCIVDGRTHGSNGKVGNLINMMAAARHDILVLSDSDIAVEPDYLERVVSALNRSGVGAVTCLYRGRGDSGFWSVLGAAGLSWQFLPSVIVSLALDAGDVCMGSTIALRRATLDAIGGFARFADILADDHALGAAVREAGLSIVVPPMIVTHASTDRSLAELLRHELRWAATVRQVNPAGYAGLIFTHPLPFALIALALAPVAGLWLTAAAIVARMLLIGNVQRRCSARVASAMLLPLRDTLSFFVFIGGFLTGSVDWRGERLKMQDQGRISADAETV
jgi:ceramide glucosyltransferase